MNTKAFSGSITCGLAEMVLDFSQLNGFGGADYPLLIWQTQLRVRPQRTALSDYAFRSIEAQLLLRNSHQKIAEAVPQPLQRIVRGHETQAHQIYLHFEFPLDARRIESIERNRAGGALSLRLKMQLQVEEHGIIDAHAESNRPPIFGLRALHELHLEEDVEIPQSVWIERVLPNIGYGKVFVLEFPAAPLSGCAALGDSFKALTQAQEAHKQGRYDDAVGKCRVALDPFFEVEERIESDGTKRRVPVLKKSWEKRVGQSTYIWMQSALGALKAEANAPHHSPNIHFGQIESQMILAVAAAVLSYAASTENSTKT